MIVKKNNTPAGRVSLMYTDNITGVKLLMRKNKTSNSITKSVRSVSSRSYAALTLVLLVLMKGKTGGQD